MLDFLVSCFALASVPILLAVASNLIRARRKYKGPIVPNCLLTRVPLQFWTGPRSLFYFASYWNETPDFLTSHGYDVEVIRLPWRDPIARRQWATQILRSQKRHLVLDATTAEEFADLFREFPPASMTIPSEAGPPALLHWISFSLHQKVIRKDRPELKPPIANFLGLSSKNTSFHQNLLTKVHARAEADWTENELFP